MLDQSNLPPKKNIPAQFGRVPSVVNHFSFHNIRMIGMPFQTRLLDLTFENDRVTCFGIHPWRKKQLYVKIKLLWSVMNWFSFLGPGSGQYMPNTPVTCHHKFQSDRCIWKSTLHCIAFRLSLMSLSRGYVFCNFFTPFPLMTPSSPNTKP